MQLTLPRRGLVRFARQLHSARPGCLPHGPVALIGFRVVAFSFDATAAAASVSRCGDARERTHQTRPCHTPTPRMWPQSRRCPRKLRRHSCFRPRSAGRARASSALACSSCERMSCSSFFDHSQYKIARQAVVVVAFICCSSSGRNGNCSQRFPSPFVMLSETSTPSVKLLAS